MADGVPLVDSPASSDPFLIRSAVRSGLKRELAFALRAQAEIPAFLGRTRSRTIPPPPPATSLVADTKAKRLKRSDAGGDGRIGSPGTIEDPVVIDVVVAPDATPSDKQRLEKPEGGEPVTPLCTRLKQEGSREDSIVESPMVIDAYEATLTTRRTTRSAMRYPGLIEVSSMNGGAGGMEEETRGMSGANATAMRMVPKRKMEMKMSKKISVTKLPSNIRELLATGLLEGMRARYHMAKKAGLTGVIKDTCILCHCASCQGSNAISAYQFEQHAGSSKRHPSDFIYLDNGKTIRDVLEACKAAPLDMLEASIQNAISLAHLKKPLTCQKCSEPFHNSDSGKFVSLCDSCLDLDQHQATPSPTDGNYGSARLSTPSDTSGSTSKNISSHQKPSFGKLTRKDLGLHKLVFMGDTLPEGTEVGYYVRGKRILQGYIKDCGILCLCCSSVLSPSQFEAHAGHAKRRKPYNNIYTSNGVSLHELSVSLSKGRKLSASENDDLCSICADGGDLLLCDLCPRAFHTDCVGLSSIPNGDWYCRYCQNMHQREKCLERNDNAIAAGRVAGVDPIEQIYKRCIRIVGTPETNVGGCVFCRRHDFSKAFGPRTVLLCDQCEREYHVGCLKDHNMGILKEIPKGEWFCSSACSRIHAALQEFVIRGEVQPQYLDTNIIKKRGEKGLDKDVNPDIRWRLLSGKTSGPGTKSLFTGAVSILHDSFDAIVESATGRDLIPCMVYGRSTRDQDFSGMYCIVLTVDSCVVSTGILRVLGCEVAELPLVATHKEKQKQGYFQLLFSCIERLLASLNVKHLVLPAAEEAESIWTNKFGFKRITSDQLHGYTKGSHTMNFQGTSMLHKLVTSGCQGS